MAKTALSPKQRLQLLTKVFKEGISVAKACREFGISRKTFYKWAKKYDRSKKRKVNLNNLRDKSRKIKRLPSHTPSYIEEEIKKIASENPGFSKYKIAEEIKCKLGKDKGVGVHGVYNVLRRAGLQTQDKREKWREFVLQSEIEARGRVLDATQRLKMIEQAVKLGLPVAQVCKDFGISRKTFYKWKNRWEQANRSSDALVDKKRQIDGLIQKIKPEYEKTILSLVVEYPNLSKYALAEKLAEKLGPVVGVHGVYNVLVRNGLNRPEARFAYSSAHTPEVPTPVTWSDRVRYVLEQFIPSLAPAPPPRLAIALASAGRPLLNFLKTFSLTSVLSSATLYSFLWWIDYITSQVAQVSVGLIFASIALTMGSIFFLYSLKYYITLAIVLSFSQQSSSAKATEDKGRGGFLSWLLGLANGDVKSPKATTSRAVGLEPSLEHITLKRYPKVSVHIPLYNERNVVERLIAATTAFDYKGDYEVVLADDSTDETTRIIRDYMKSVNGKRTTVNGEGWTLTQVEVRPGVTLKHLHRTSRSGFKGGALADALKHTDKRAEFVVVFDADFVPYPDTLTLFLKYFQATAGTLDFRKGSRVQGLGSSDNTKPHTLVAKPSPIAAVQGYQWHVLNKSENWITRGIRSEYAGSYVIERSGEEIYGGLKQISGAVYMVRRDVLDEIGWETSITEDFQLTLKLYEKGYKVVYTPYIQAPAECVSTLKRLIRQRMRWAEGHSNNVRKMFIRLIYGQWSMVNGQKEFTPSPLTLSEKLEFLYVSPYYLQAFFFLVGTISWLISETVFQAGLPFWTSLWGWSLVFTNLLSLPLMNAVGLFLEESEERDYQGILSFILLSYIVVPFQAYASLKGFLQKKEGPWFRTPKTGHITDVFTRGRFYRFISGILPGRAQPAVAQSIGSRVQAFGSEAAQARRGLGSSLLNPNFSFSIHPRRRRWLSKATLAGLLVLVMLLNYLAFWARPVSAVSAGPNDPGTIITEDGIDGDGGDWSNPSNAASSNDQYATITLSGFAHSESLKATNFGFNIDSDATIDGILVEVERSEGGDDFLSNVRDHHIFIVKNDVIQTDEDKVDGLTNWPATDAYASYGGSTDLWSKTWVASDINDSGFGVVVACDRTGSGGSETCRVDHIRITVDYTAGGGGDLPKIAQQINIIDQEYSNATSTYAPTDSSLGLIDHSPTDYDGIDYVYLEAVVKCVSCSGRGAWVILYNDAGGEISMSGVITTSSSYVRAYSRAVNSTDLPADEYTVRVKVSDTGTAYVKAARLVIVQTSSDGVSDTQTHVEVGNNDTTTSTSYELLTNEKIYLWDANRFSGTVNVYFETSLKGSDASAVSYAALSSSATCASTVSGSERTVTGTTWSRQRSGSISLTDDTEYWVCVHTTSADTGSIANAKVIVDQTDASHLTDIELVHHYINTGISETATSLTVQEFDNQFDDDHFVAGTFTYYFETTMYCTTGCTATADLFDGAASITNSNITTTNETATRARSGAALSGMPTTPTDLDTRLQATTGDTTTANSSWLIIQVSNLQIPENILFFLPLVLFLPKIFAKSGFNLAGLNLRILNPTRFRKRKKKSIQGNIVEVTHNG